ncbi:hypothetical protein L6452_25447 [Arctium lappa]|uniref:Uncharacterized protein n=1 Tax=Arctium lappa TaxID=4217 RepID=A0ACB9ABJ5_ARCLA|nr:hypothetical protein L6452_25447 [Arctium lappa]
MWTKVKQDRPLLPILPHVKLSCFEPTVPLGIRFEGKIGIWKELFDALLACTSLYKLVMHFDMVKVCA